jgi:hypothetical protein
MLYPLSYEGVDAPGAGILVDLPMVRGTMLARPAERALTPGASLVPASTTGCCGSLHLREPGDVTC